MLTRLREALKPALDAFGKNLSKISPEPNFWTALGLVFSLISAYFFYSSSYLLASFFLLASGLMDVADGAVAKSSGKTSRKGGFLDSNMDRIGEVAIYLALILASKTAYFTFAASLALSFSLLVSYARARAEASGINAEGIGYGERAERIIILAIGGFIDHLFYALIAISILAFITYLQRLIIYSSRLQQPSGL